MLTPFWRFLEQRPTAAAVMVQWKARVGLALPLIAGLLQPRPALAGTYPHPAGGEPLRVVNHRDGTWVAVSPEDPALRIPLAPADLVVHALDARRLRAAIAATLRDVVPGRAVLETNQRQFRVGYWRPKPGAEFPIDFAVPRDTRVLAAAIQGADARSFLLTPTGTLWDDELRQRAAARKVMLGSLAEIIDAGDAGWRETAAWVSYLGAFAAMIESSLPGNYQNRRQPARRAQRLTTIERLAQALEDHIRAARDHAFDLESRGKAMKLLPRPEQQELAREVGISESAVSRALGDPAAKVLRILWQTAGNLQAVLSFK